MEVNLKPTVRYLAEELGPGREGAAEAARKQPSVLGYGMEKMIKPKLAFLFKTYYIAWTINC